VLAKIEEHIFDVVCRLKPEVLITHSVWGEYGHLDHIWLRSVIGRHFPAPLLYSDIFVSGTGWSNLEPSNAVAAHVEVEVQNDLCQYVMHKSYYDAVRCWTWNQKPVKECTVWAANQ
jgi:hypothetical protein